MIVRVCLFAAVRELVGQPAVEIELTDGDTVKDLRTTMIQQYPDLRSLLDKSAFSVDHDFADDATKLSAGAEVAIIPPVSGG